MKLCYRQLSMQKKITGFILIISLFMIGLSVLIFYMAWGNYTRAKNLERTSQITGELFQVIKGFAFERGRMNVALTSAMPVTPENRAFIQARRQLVDTYLATGLRRLIHTHPATARDITISFDALKALRKKADAESRKKYAEREPGFASVWLKQSTDFIYQMESVLRFLGKEQAESGRFFLYHQLALDSLRFRTTIGHHATVLTGALVTTEPLNDKEYQDNISLKTQADYLWSGIEAQVADLGNEKLSKAKDLVYANYYKYYRPEQERLTSLAYQANVEIDSVRHLQKLSVSAFDSVFLLVEAAEAESEWYVKTLRHKANWMFAAGFVQFAFCILLIIFCITYFNKQVFLPLKRIVCALEQIRNGEDKDTPVLKEVIGRQDEIGLLVQGVRLLQATMAEERRLKTENEHLAMTDYLTGCLNKRAFYLRAEAEVCRSVREKASVSFVFADLDYLKKINDTFGHVVGDEVVKHFTQIIADQCRPDDLFGRFGGDEFVLCFPRTDTEQALDIIARMQEVLQKSNYVAGSDGASILISASFGVISSIADETKNVDWFIHQADIALYKAKQSGRNCVVVQSETPD